MSDQTETTISLDDRRDDKNNDNLSEETGKKVIYSFDDNVELLSAKRGEGNKEDGGNNSTDTNPSIMYTYKRTPPPSESSSPAKRDHNYTDKFSTPGKPPTRVKTINDLKKVLPKLKLISPEVSTLKELTKVSKPLETPALSKKNSPQTRKQLRDYCRTCAGLKIPLVDIFGEKGIQMRLNQQMKHLEEIDKHDGLSTQMCMDCICDLKMSYKFFMQIKKAQVKLKSLINTPNNEEKPRVMSIPDSLTKKSPIEPIQPQNDPPTPPAPTRDPLALTDNESLEEFDPDDSQMDNEPLHSSEQYEDPKKAEEPEIHEKTPEPEPAITNECVKTEPKSQSVYEYNSELNTYIKMDPDNLPPAADIEELEDQLKKQGNVVEKHGEVDSDSSQKQNTLKRKAPSLGRDSLDSQSASESTDTLLKSMKDAKLQKLMGNPLSVSSSNEEGIMYVTVKGSKPNELLLVKVKKMDKNGDRKDESKSLVMKKPFDMPLKSVEKALKALPLKSPDSPKKLGSNRGAIIEQQIEQYKKKREKILGADFRGSVPSAPKYEDGAVRFVNSVQSMSETSDDGGRGELSDGESKKYPKIKFRTYSSRETDENRPLSTKEYLAKFAKLKRKWEEAKAKKAALQQELSASYTEGNLEKLTRILGEREKNLQDFQEYLRQRKIVITKLKDEDIISLYEGRTPSEFRKKFPDLIDEDIPIDGSVDFDFLDCDYCIQTFSHREVLEEHLKTHDYKIFYFCEDCGGEFSTNKSKRAHNVTCIKKLVCKYCDFMLESRGKKRQHEQKHCDQIYGQLCDICGEKFKHQGTLDQHVKTQHMSWEKIFECPKCPKKFAFKQKLSFHVKSVHTTMRAYLCEDCGADFKNPASLRHHRIRKHQPTGNKRECQICHKMVPFYSLSKHMYTHKEYTIQCPHCDKMFKNSSTLKQHVRIHEDQRQYRCDTCGVGFNRRDGLRLHMRVHEKTDSRALKECSCQICSEKFPNHSMLVIHRNRVHKDGKQYTCKICNRSMLSTRSLDWHMSHIHNEITRALANEGAESPVEKTRVTCNHCMKTFKTEMILRTHIKNTHMEKNPVKCPDCEVTFTSEVRLRHHMMVTHNRLEGTLTCPHCPKRFVNQLRLKTHMISHSEDRPFTCEICGFNLKTKIQLIKHHQNRHSDERPLQCRYCPWRCKQVSALVCHERTHTNERPYSCSVCEQRFKYLGDKNKHERRHESLGGSGFKRIVTGRNAKKIKGEAEGDTSEDQDQELEEQELEDQEIEDQEYEIEGQLAEEYGEVEEFDAEKQIVKYEEQDIEGEYEQEYEQEYEETSREASEAAEVIMNMEDGTVYTEEVTADNIEEAEMITGEIMTSQILQSGTVVHIQQQDDDGKIQVIPVMLSIPDLTDGGGEVNLATASIMYNSG